MTTSSFFGKPIFSVFETHKHKETENFISFQQLIDLASNPSVRQKHLANLIIPYLSQRKTKSATEDALCNAIILDHDNDNASAEMIGKYYQMLNITCLIYSTSNHLVADNQHPNANNRWKVVIPLEEGVNTNKIAAFKTGLAFYTCTDIAQARSQQGFYAPNKLNQDSPYQHFYLEAKPFNFSDKQHQLHQMASEGLIAMQKKQKELINKSTAKPRVIDNESCQNDLIEKINRTFPIYTLLEKYNYTKSGDAWLSPTSESGSPGVYILDSNDGKQRLYSHHGPADPLSAENHGRHSLDATDIICTIEYSGNLSKALAELAPIVDPDGQRKRQQNYAESRNQSNDEQVITRTNKSYTYPYLNPKIQINSPPGLAGKICRLIQLQAKRPREELYPISALHILALAGSHRSSSISERLNLLSIGIGLTASGKEKPQEIIKTLSKSINFSSNVHGEIGSFKEMIYNLIDGEKVAIYVIDEVHSLLGSMKSRNAASHETKIESEILKMSTTDLYTFRGMERRNYKQISEESVLRCSKAQKNLDKDSEEYRYHQKEIAKAKQSIDWIDNGMERPFFSLMGHSTPGNIDKYISEENIESGLIGRCIIIRCPDDRKPLNRNEPNDLEITALKNEIHRSLINIKNSQKKVTLTPEAERFIEKCTDFFDDDIQRNHPYLGGIFARAPEHMNKIASILGLETGEITLEQAEYAYALVNSSINDIRYLLRQAVAKNSKNLDAIKQQAKDKILKNCQGEGKSKSKIKEIVEKPNNWKYLCEREPGKDHFKELMDELLKDGSLIRDQVGKKDRFITTQ